MSTRRVALYARVSALLAQSPEMQLVELREYAARRCLQVLPTGRARAAIKLSLNETEMSSLDILSYQNPLTHLKNASVWGTRRLRETVESAGQVESVAPSWLAIPKWE